jgi:RNA polymerase sigma-70 factor (ECF subfamily)
MARFGSRHAFERSVLEHLPDALNLAIRLTGDPDSAEDIVQEALVRAARGWSGFRGEASCRTWLFRIVINVFRDQLDRRPMAELPEELLDARAVGVVTQAEAGELAEIIAQLISALPPRQREVLVLSTYENLDPSEIASLLQISQANVYATLHVARERLRSQLAPYFAES